MKIARVTATPLNVPLHIKLVGVDRQTSLACCHVEVETDDGLIGHGLTSITEEDVIAQIVNGVAGPAILGDDPLAHERIWDKLYWTLMPRGQTGYAAHALAAIDVALWDIKGKALRQPVWRLLGGTHPRVPVYATFGFGFFDREQLAAAAKLWVAQGFTRLKMTVGNEALRAPRQAAGDGGDPRGRCAGARGARGGRLRTSSCSSTPTATSISITRPSSSRWSSRTASRSSRSR